MTDDSVTIEFSPAPSDPAEKKRWADGMLRLQVALWVDDGERCAHCGRPYTSVDDFIARDVRDGGRGPGNTMLFVDGGCWPEYARTHGYPVEVPP